MCKKYVKISTSEERVIECPGIAHELDTHYSVALQGPYDDGYHDCELCENQGMISEMDYHNHLHENIWLDNVAEHYFKK